MTAEVVELNVITTLDLPVDRVLNRALTKDLKSVIIIGETEDGDEYFASSVSGGADVVWQLERAKLKLLRLADGGER